MSISCVEPAIDPNNRITFLLDWELTMKCNLDCHYCGTDIETGGHNNTTSHPKKEDCFKSIDFMFEYVDLYMSTKTSAFKKVVLNVYGGEALYHPDIVEILLYLRTQYNKYRDNWSLTITTTTNLIVPESKLLDILPLIDKFTVTYHSEINDKQLQKFKDNLSLLKNQNKELACIVLMYPKHFEKCISMIEWLKAENITALPRQLDHTDIIDETMFYKPSQITWFDKFYETKASIKIVKLDNSIDKNLTDQGRACCGARKLSVNQNYKQKTFYIKNNFFDWYCSVNHFFLFVKQVNGKIYTNKDCKMGFNGAVESIGTLDNVQPLLEFTKQGLISNTLPVIQCKKNLCLCGLCAPKSNTFEDYKSIMKKYQAY